MNNDLNPSFISELHNLNEKQLCRRYKFLGEGISRKVFALNDIYVLKLAKGKEGLYQNKVEYHVYSHVNPTLKKYLCPIIYFDPKLIIMLRAEPISQYIKSDFIDLHNIRPEKTVFEDLNYLASHYYLYYKDIKATSSWGKLNNENILIDYGCTNEIGDIFYDMLFLFNK